MSDAYINTPDAESRDDENTADGQSQGAEEAPRGYVVDPNFRPNPADRVGSIRTGAEGDINVRRVASGFAVADRRSLLTAHRALDPGDPAVSASHVNLYPQTTVPTYNSVRERIWNTLERVKDDLTFQDHVATSTTRSQAAIAAAINQGNDQLEVNAPEEVEEREPVAQVNPAVANAPTRTDTPAEPVGGGAEASSPYPSEAASTGSSDAAPSTTLVSNSENTSDQ